MAKQSNEYHYFCYDCQDWYPPEILCARHPIVHEPTRKASAGSRNRIRELLPRCLQISKSPIAGLGIFAKEDIKERTVFGPYQGEYLDMSTTPKTRITEAETSARAYEIMEGNAKTVIGLVDGGVKEFACFLSKINCARNHKEHNVDSFQYSKSVYFRTIKPIKRGQELLVRYGDVYEKQLSIEFNNPNPKTTYFQENQDGLFFCPLCNICFHTREAFNIHKSELKCQIQKVIKKTGTPMFGSNDEPFICASCGQCYSEICLLQYHQIEHDGLRKFGCDKCCLRFLREEHYQEHMKWCKPDFPS